MACEAIDNHLSSIVHHPSYSYYKANRNMERFTLPQNPSFRISVPSSLSLAVTVYELSLEDFRKYVRHPHPADIPRLYSRHVYTCSSTNSNPAIQCIPMRSTPLLFFHFSFHQRVYCFSSNDHHDHHDHHDHYDYHQFLTIYLRYYLR